MDDTQTTAAAPALDDEDFMEQIRDRIVELEAQNKEARASYTIYASVALRPGPDAQRTEAKAQAALQISLQASNRAEIETLRGLLADAEANASKQRETARVEQLEQTKRGTFLKVGRALRRRQELALELEALVETTASAMAKLIQLGDAVHMELAPRMSPDQALSCAPDRYWVDHCFMGVLLRAGAITEEGFARFADHGMNGVQSAQPLSMAVEHQHALLKAQFEARGEGALFEEEGQAAEVAKPAPRKKPRVMLVSPDYNNVPLVPGGVAP